MRKATGCGNVIKNRDLVRITSNPPKNETEMLTVGAMSHWDGRVISRGAYQGGGREGMGGPGGGSSSAEAWNGNRQGTRRHNGTNTVRTTHLFTESEAGEVKTAEKHGGVPNPTMNKQTVIYNSMGVRLPCVM